MKRRILCLLILQLLIVNNANADSLIAQGGLQHTPNSNDGDGIVTSLGYEKTLLENSLGELDAKLSYDYHGPTSVYPESAPDYGDFSGHAVLAGLTWHLPIELLQARPYLGALFGWSWWDFDESEDTKMRDINVDTGDSFCEKYSIGGNWKLSDHWSLNIEWHFFKTDIPKDAHYPDGSHSNILDTGKTRGHGPTNFLVGLRYEF